jgi:hypothetical protein
MSSSSKKIVLKKLNQHNTIWHPESTLVFKSQKDRLVIGRYVDDKIIPLDEEALNLCETWKFKPDESLFDSDEKAENEESEEENVDKDIDQVPTVVTKDTVLVSTVVHNDSSLLVKKSENNSGTSLLEDLTDKFTKQVFAQFNLLNEENTCLKSQLTENETAFAELQKKYDDIKKKFDTMKSLFN